MKPLVHVAFACVVFACGCGGDYADWSVADASREKSKAAPTAAATTGDFKDGLLDRAAAIEAAKAVDRTRFPNADDVLVDDHILTRYEADGTSVMWDDWYVKVLTEKGRKRRQVLSIYFTIPYSQPEDVKVHKLEVIKPDGNVVAVDVERQSRIMINRSQMSANIYNPNSKILQVGVPGLEVGDLVHYLTYKRVRHPRVKNVWGDIQVFEYTSPILRYVYEVVSPAERSLARIELKDPLPGTVTHTTREEGGRTVHRWEARNVPRMFAEPRMPGLSRVVQRLLISTAPDWETISRWYWSISEPHYQTTPEIEAKVGTLAGGIGDRRKKLEALFGFVSQKVRYLGITKEDTAPGYEPHDVADTFGNLAGVCRDKAALLVAMLREAGFDAYPVLIQAGDKMDADVPLPWFNHAIVAVREESGEYTLMDPTDENTKQLLPAYLNDKSFLVATPGGETLKISAIVPATDNLMRISTTGRIDASGDIAAESVLRFDGQNDNGYRGYFARIKPEERRRYFEAVVKRTVPGARLTRCVIKPDDMMDTSTALTVELAFSASDVLVDGERVHMLPVPSFGARVGYASFILRGTGLEKRKYPLKTQIACGVREELRLEIDPAIGRLDSLPQYVPVEDATVTYKRELRSEGQTLAGSSEFLLKVVEFSPSEYATLKETLRTIEYNERKMPIVAAAGRLAARDDDGATGAAKKEESGVDAIILSDEVVYKLDDARNWTETRTLERKILTYAGKKDYADIRVGYNTSWEEVTLLSATVTDEKGNVKKAAPEEINRMDAGWVGSAPRYPASKTLVVSLPGVEVGSVIAYTLVTKHKDKPFFAVRESFRSTEPSTKKKVRVVVPDGVTLRIHRTWARDGAVADAPPATESKTSRDGVTTYTWSIEDAKPVKRERGLPPWYGFVPTVFFSAGDWAAYARDVDEALRAAATGQPGAEAKARSLVEGAAGSQAPRVTAVRDYVARNVRRAGPSLSEVPLSAVTAADTSLSEGYGTSADRAVVIYAMLEAMGLDPEFVLASGAPRIDELQEPLRAAPDPSWFGSVLVRVRVDDTVVYPNDTDQYAALGATHRDGRPGLLADGRIAPIEPPETHRDRSKSHYRIEVDAEGNASFEVERAYYGTAYGSRRKFYAELPPEERRREYQKMIASLSQSARPAGDLVTAFDAYPGRESFKATWSRFAVRDGDKLYFELPGSLGGLFRFMADSRENPLYRGGDRRVDISATIALPPEFTRVLLLPPEVSWREPGTGSTVTVGARLVKGASPRLEVTWSACLVPAVIPASEYPRMLAIMRELSHPRARMVLLSR